MTTSFVTGLDANGLWDLVDEAPGRITRDVQVAAKSLGVHVVWPTYRRGPERGVVYNSAILIGPDGEIIGIYDKTHPFPLERCDCGGWVTLGNRADVFETALGSIGMIICYDGDFPELSRLLAVKGAEVIVRPSALLRSYRHLVYHQLLPAPTTITSTWWPPTRWAPTPAAATTLATA